MPSYDFVCNKCGHKFSVFCSISSKENTKCPQCASDRITQRFTALNTCGGKGRSGCLPGKCGSGCSC